jgi:hypothetical protein
MNAAFCCVELWNFEYEIKVKNYLKFQNPFSLYGSIEL